MCSERIHFHKFPVFKLTPHTRLFYHFINIVFIVVRLDGEEKSNMSGLYTLVCVVV